jgi:DNA excision repair protein ERCC-6
MNQWVQEFHRWWPQLRVIVLHETGTAGERSVLFLKRAMFTALGPAVLLSTYESVR